MEKHRQHTPKLYYFDAYGRGELIRLIFYHAGVKFEDIRLSFAEFGKLKAEGFFPNGQVPLLEFEGKRMPQSISIARYLSRIYGYYPADIDLAYDVEVVGDCITDTLKNVMKLVYQPDSETKREGLKNWYQNELPTYLKNFDSLFKRATGGNGYFVGRTMTFADFSLVFLYALLAGTEEKKEWLHKALENHPDLKHYFSTRVGEFSEYFAKRPGSILFGA